MPRNISGLKPFKPGQTSNPNGRNGCLPPEIRTERKKNQAGLIRLITQLFSLTPVESKNRARDPKLTQLEKAVQAVVRSATKGDVNALRYLVEIMVGKIPEHDYDGFTEEDLRILNRVKEVFHESPAELPDAVGSGH